MSVKYLNFIIALVTCSVKTEIKLPDYITACKRDDPNLGDCFVNRFNAIVPRISKGGIPEMNVSAIEPFVLDQVSINTGKGEAFSLHCDLQDIKIRGLKDTKAVAASFDFPNNIFKLAMKNHNPYLEARYNAKGNVLLFPFNSSGYFNLNFVDSHLNFTFRGEQVIRNGLRYSYGNISDIDCGMKGAKIYVTNLFPNDELNTVANQALNANVEAIYNAMKPLVLGSIANVIANIFNKVFMTFPSDVLFPLE